QHGQVREDPCLLEGAGQPVPIQAAGAVPGDVPPGEVDVAGISSQVPGDDVENRGLAGAVRADEGRDRAIVHSERTGVHGLHAAERLRETVDGQLAHADRRRTRDGTMPRGRTSMMSRNTSAYAIR